VTPIGFGVALRCTVTRILAPGVGLSSAANRLPERRCRRRDAQCLCVGTGAAARGHAAAYKYSSRIPIVSILSPGVEAERRCHAAPGGQQQPRTAMAARI